MFIYQDLASLLLRLSLGAGFLSAVASRLGLWGKHSSGWTNFVNYTGQVNSFMPASMIPTLAVVATALEMLLGILLLTGFKTGYAALAAAILSLLFAIAMSISAGVKDPLDYSVFAFSAGAFLLSTLPAHKWSIDQLIAQ
ncbi:DoxX family membrane protein [Paraflavitalea sp. CAU 1676]|uniref:MauE/DoxX family redox-associated membrane protein n=1 Tax=Paraflavitalea sp. CAU 1676 TaxID=3032598 RepID=UPI0023DCBB94|nr:DoxX family membrane protein [Paraflavitalea sp. CAU 1676]MDF2186838.1 DoxX family membrane protein [Paraflavitalea sp. CAU 1676]